MTGMRRDATAMEDDDDGRAHLGAVGRCIVDVARRMKGRDGRDHNGGAGNSARRHGTGRDARGAGPAPGDATNGAGVSLMLGVSRPPT